MTISTPTSPLTHIFLPAALALTGLACQLDQAEDELGGEVFREAGVAFAQTWHVEGERRLGEVECEAAMNELCAELSPGECAIAQSRTVCESLVSGEGEHQGVALRDAYGVGIDWDSQDILDLVGFLHDARWAGYSAGDEGVSTAPAEASPAQLCETMQGVAYNRCLTMAQAAEQARDRADELLEDFPQGGVGTLREHDGVLVISSFEGEPGGDLFTATADALDWRLPALDGEFVLGEGLGYGTPKGGCTITIVPNGTVIVASATAAIMPEPLPKPQSQAMSSFTYTMSSPAANYNWGNSHVVGGWSRYAAIWKSYADAMVGSVNLASAYAGSNLDPLLGADATLDQHESLHFTDIWGASYDPNGTWYSVDIDNPVTGLAYASIAMHYWGTPVFVSGEYVPSPFVAPAGSWYGDIAIEQVSWTSSAHTSLLDACGVLPTDSASDALTKVNTGACALTSVSLTGGVISAWLGDLSPVQAPDLLHHHSVSAGELLSTYWAGYTWSLGVSSGRVGELVLDPPASASEEEIEAVIELGRVLGEQLNEQLDPGGEVIDEMDEQMQEMGELE